MGALKQRAITRMEAGGKALVDGSLDRRVAEPALIHTAVEELLRFESPLPLNNRLCTAHLSFGGRDVPSGSFITLAIGAAHRGPAELAAAKRDQRVRFRGLKHLPVRLA